jgi:hypothetical protein
MVDRDVIATKLGELSDRVGRARTSHVISDEGWIAPRTLADAFARLAEHGVISAEVATALARAAGLRNVVARGYAGVDPTLVFAGATRGLDDLDRFAREIGAWSRRPRDLPSPAGFAAAAPRRRAGHRDRDRHARSRANSSAQEDPQRGSRLCRRRRRITCARSSRA